MMYAETYKVELGELLFEDAFTDTDLSKNWEISGGEWTSGDGTCVGVFRGNAGGLIYSKKQFPGDIVLDFYGTIISPCDHDLNWSFRTRGWDYEKNDADIGYIAGLNGWWINRTGIERYPECALRALTEAFKAEADREYHIQTGIINDIAFVAVDGKMIMTLRDPNPICDETCNRVGLGTYCSQIRFRDFKVYKARATNEKMKYIPKF